MSDHDLDLEQTALFALGCLNQEEAQAARRHLMNCTLCSDEYALLAPTGDALALSAESGAQEYTLPLRRVKKKLLAQIKPAKTTQFRWYQGIAAIACCIAIGASFWAYTRKSDDIHPTSQSADVRLSPQTVALLLAPGTKRYPLAHGTVLIDNHGLYLILTRLPALPPGHVFQAWTLAKGAKKMQPDRIFTDSLDDLTAIQLMANPATTSAVALSIEPSGGSLQPTTPALFVRRVG